jgi:hypothetical protein
MAEIGIGLIILIALWSITVIFVVLFCSAQGNLKFIAIAPCIISAIVTIILVSIPKGNQVEEEKEPDYAYSYTSLIWILVLTSLVLFLVISMVIYLITDIMEPKYAKVAKVAKSYRT